MGTVYVGDPTIDTIVEATKKRPKIRNWFALAVVAGVLLALAVVAVLA